MQPPLIKVPGIWKKGIIIAIASQCVVWLKYFIQQESAVNVWQDIEDIVNPSEKERHEAQDLVLQFRENGYINQTPTGMLHYSDGFIASFYARLMSEAPAESPVKQEPDSCWMAESDFCFLNIRAAGLDAKPGTIIQAAKMLPVIRASAIHLAPFTRYDFQTIYAVASNRTISDNIVDKSLRAAGITGELQLKAFTAAVHGLGKTVGFDLVPHTAQFSIPVLTSPAHFRWIKLSADREQLSDNHSMDSMLTEEVQQQITSEVEQIVLGRLSRAGLAGLDSESADDESTRDLKKDTYYALIGTLIDKGYWTIPSQVWSGDGVPAFDSYNFEDNYARFTHRDREGNNADHMGYHIVTPYAFYTNPAANKSPLRPGDVKLKPESAAYFASIFEYWRDEFDFDFVRYDSFDHIFDSVARGLPLADRPTPEVLGLCTKRSKSPAKPYIGNLAERMGNEIELYGPLGFDLVLGDDMLSDVCRALVEKSFDLYDRLYKLNEERKTEQTIAFCVDTHDTGNPHFWGEPLLKVCGFQKMKKRHFLSRFLSIGRAKRPKYEVMGLQDLSWGLYQSNVSDENLTWVDDRTFNRLYHYLEDVYSRFKPFLHNGVMKKRFINDHYAWWIIENGQELLVPCLSIQDRYDYHHVPIDLNDLIPPGLSHSVTEYDFDGLFEKKYPLANRSLYIPVVNPDDVKLFYISPAFK